MNWVFLDFKKYKKDYYYNSINIYTTEVHLYKNNNNIRKLSKNNKNLLDKTKILENFTNSNKKVKIYLNTPIWNKIVFLIKIQFLIQT